MTPGTPKNPAIKARRKLISIPAPKRLTTQRMIAPTTLFVMSFHTMRNGKEITLPRTAKIKTASATPAAISKLYLPSVFHGARERHLICVLEIAAHGQSMCDTRHANPHRLQEFGNIHCRRLALDVGVGRDDDLLHILLARTQDELADADVVRPHAFERGECAMQNVVHAVIVVHALHRRNILWLLDDTDRRVVAFFRHADGARVAVREVEADGTKADLLLRSRNGSGKTMRSLHIHVQDMVGEPRRRLCPDAGEGAQLLDELREGCDLLHIRAVRAAGRGRSSACPSPAPSCRPPFSSPR